MKTCSEDCKDNQLITALKTSMEEASTYFVIDGHRRPMLNEKLQCRQKRMQARALIGRDLDVDDLFERWVNTRHDCRVDFAERCQDTHSLYEMRGNMPAITAWNKMRTSATQRCTCARSINSCGKFKAIIN